MKYRALSNELLPLPNILLPVPTATNVRFPLSFNSSLLNSFVFLMLLRSGEDLPLLPPPKKKKKQTHMKPSDFSLHSSYTKV